MAITAAALGWCANVPSSDKKLRVSNAAFKGAVAVDGLIAGLAIALTLAQFFTGGDAMPGLPFPATMVIGGIAIIQTLAVVALVTGRCFNACQKCCENDAKPRGHKLPDKPVVDESSES